MALVQHELQTKDEPKFRLEVVGMQYQIEKEITSCKNAAAVFMVPTLLTPMFISPNSVEVDNGLFVLKKGAQIPDGLIPEEKLQDKQQLSTVLGRVLTVYEMLKAHTKIVILYVDDERKKADKKMGFVNKEQTQALLRSFSDNLMIKKIPSHVYEAYKTKVCAATYYFINNKNEKTGIGIDATQINVAHTAHDWGVKQEREASEKISHLNGLLKENDLLTIQEIMEATSINKIEYQRVTP